MGSYGLIDDHLFVFLNILIAYVTNNDSARIVLFEVLFTGRVRQVLSPKLPQNHERLDMDAVENRANGAQ